MSIKVQMSTDSDSSPPTLIVDGIARWVLIAFDYSIGVKNAVFFHQDDLAPHIQPEHRNSTERMLRWFERYDSCSCVIVNAWCELES